MRGNGLGDALVGELMDAGAPGCLFEPWPVASALRVFAVDTDERR